LTRATTRITIASLPKFIGAATRIECIGDRSAGIITIARGQLITNGWIIKSQIVISVVTAWRASSHGNGIAIACCD
jgi:hypothetical protein